MLTGGLKMVRLLWLLYIIPATHNLIKMWKTKCCQIHFMTQALFASRTFFLYKLKQHFNLLIIYSNMTNYYSKSMCIRTNIYIDIYLPLVSEATLYLQSWVASDTNRKYFSKTDWPKQKYHCLFFWSNIKKCNEAQRATSKKCNNTRSLSKFAKNLPSNIHLTPRDASFEFDIFSS